MGKKKTPVDAENEEKSQQEKSAQAEKSADAKNAEGDVAETKPNEEEDLPIVKQLKEIDDKYLEIEREYEKKIYELQKKYMERQAPLLKERTSVLTKDDSEGGAKTGTPALKGFWLQAMKNLSALEDQIEEWDEPVLEYCCDVTTTYLSETDINKGFRLEFHFVENPYFDNSVLWKEYHTEEESPYTGELEKKEIKVSEINWKSGKDVTVETVKKKVKGGGAKKAKQKGKEKAEPRDSLFRNFFRHLKSDMPVPDDVEISDDDEDMMNDDEEMMRYIMENDHEMGVCVRDHLIPFAVRYYTGEAEPDAGSDDDDDEDDEDDEEDSDDDEDDDDDDSDDEPVPKKKQAPKKKVGSGGDSKPKIPGAGDGQNKEECKQQ